jgi:hypothetical protein
VGLRVWTPEHPELYDLRLELILDDQPLDVVDSYFGMREVSIKNGVVLLNGRPYYQRLILDQGYWEESHLTPRARALLEDIEKTKALGFNGPESTRRWRTSAIITGAT